MFNINSYELFFNQTGKNKRLITSNLGEDREKQMLSLPGEEHRWYNPFVDSGGKHRSKAFALRSRKLLPHPRGRGKQ